MFDLDLNRAPLGERFFRRFAVADIVQQLAESKKPDQNGDEVKAPQQGIGAKIKARHAGGFVFADGSEQ